MTASGASGKARGQLRQLIFIVANKCDPVVDQGASCKALAAPLTRGPGPTGTVCVLERPTRALSSFGRVGDIRTTFSHHWRMIMINDGNSDCSLISTSGSSLKTPIVFLKIM